MWGILYKGVSLWHIYIRDNGKQEFTSRSAAMRKLQQLKDEDEKTWSQSKVVKLD